VLANLLHTIGQTEGGSGQQNKTGDDEENPSLQVDGRAAPREQRPGSQTGQKHRDQQNCPKGRHLSAANDLSDLAVDN
jgi:hypothetical protein